MQEAQTITGWDNEKRPVKRGYPPADVVHYCVNMKSWQDVRLSMKGKPTHEKLEILASWWDKQIVRNETWQRAVEVQVGNYLGALRRGGQLDENNQIRKYI